MKFKPTSPSFSESSDPKKSSSPSDSPYGQSVEGASLDDALRIDRFRLRRLKKKLSAEEFQSKLAQSVAQHEKRKAANPRLEYPDELPISSHRGDIVQLIRDRQVIVVCGETGSGKSTQLPKFCLEAGLGRQAMIGHTQPRRLAARSIATRLSEELDTQLGKLVGYQVRFGDQTTPETLIKLMTDGILLAETQSDRFLDAYDAIIIDEAHERSLNIDFLMGFLRQLQGKRPDLKIIITSATIDAERFAEHFADEEGPAPIVNVEGRGFPVETRYLPWEEVASEVTAAYDLSRHVIAGIDSLSGSSGGGASAGGAGDTLVFLPTERDIRFVSHRVSGHFTRKGMDGRVDLLPLYARLPQKEQQKIFQPSGSKRRIIFATNVAESSLTVPGIHCVVDAGTARISRYSPRSKVQRLPIEPVSRASADQRAGRCGRVGPGICVRLFSQDDYESRDDFTTPEIRRTNLASVILKTKTLRVGRLEEFPLLDPPRPESIREGVRTLVELGAMDDRQELTDIGWKLGYMPVDPRVGRIILAADEYGVLPEILPIAAALEIPDPRDRPPEKQQAADEAHSQFADPRSDFLSWLRLWRYYEESREEHSRNKLTRVLRKQFLSPNRMREWSDIYRQLKDTAATSLSDRKPRDKKRDDKKRGDKTHGDHKSKRRKIGAIRFNDDDSKLVDDAKYDAIHQSLMTGLLSSIATIGDKNEYLGAGGLKLHLWPGSGVFDSKPKWIVAAELVETTRQYARTVARIQPQWIEKIAAHLLKRSYSEPHWGGKAGGAFCYERVTLYGLPIVARRRVPLPPLDPGTSRDLLIEHGLVASLLKTNAKFVRHNERLLEQITALAAKTRRRDLVIDSYVIERFYQARLPEDISDRGRLESYAKKIDEPSWIKNLTSVADVSAWLQSPPSDIADENSLYMNPGDLVDVKADEISREDFPDELAVGGSRLPLEYHFEPGSERDGVSLKIHQAALSQISDDRLGWLVPGLLHKKLVSMIKSLPKRIRRNLIPAADVAQSIVDELQESHGADLHTVPFMPAVCQAMSRRADMTITEHDFQAEKLDDHLQFLIQVVDDAGETIAAGRSAAPLQQQVGSSDAIVSEESNPVDDESWSRESMTTFDIDALPKEILRERGGVRVAQYPGLVDSGDAVATRLFSDQVSAETSTRLGLMRLYAIADRKELRSQVRHLPSWEQAKIKLTGVVSSSEMESSLIDLLARIAFVENQPLVRTPEEFEARRTNRIERIAKATHEVATWLTALADAYFEVRRQLESANKNKNGIAIGDIRTQIKWLMPPDFLSFTPWQWLKHYPRYLKAIAYRLDKLRSGSAARDDESNRLIADLNHQWLVSMPEQDQNATTQAASEFRWMVEELRVSLFAQPLGTSVKVSAKRCEKLLS